MIIIIKSLFAHGTDTIVIALAKCIYYVFLMYLPRRPERSFNEVFALVYWVLIIVIIHRHALYAQYNQP